MDPLSSVKEFHQQEGEPRRVVRIAPPPIIPVTVSAPDPVQLADTGEAEPTGLATDIDAEGAEEGAEPRRGFQRGRKQVLQVYLPVPARVYLEEARAEHGTLGKAAMVALRGSYEWLVENFTPAPAEAVGPFPAPRPTRRRLAVEDPRMRQLLLDPAEVAGIESLADELEMSLSELVTVAIDHFFGERPAAPNPSRRRSSATDNRTGESKAADTGPT